jgi:FAD/FMN-containing dehydrogenase
VVEAIEKLMAAIPDKVFLPDSSEYASSIESYFFKTARQCPACIFRPMSEEDVSVALKLLAAFPEVKIAIRSGGHSPNPNHNNIESGVTFDLRGLKTLELSGERQVVVEVDAGCDWDAVYELLEKNGRSAVGSREPSVGVAGFITGGKSLSSHRRSCALHLTRLGGLSFFSPEHGFSCDNVVNFRVVLASGDIVTANAAENSDLYRAIRGGQSNFGIVTRFDIITHDRPTFWGGGILYPYECEQANLDAFIALKQGEYDPYAAVVQSFLYFGFQKAFCISNNMVYLQHVEKPEGLRKFEEIQPQIKNTMRLDTTRSHGAELQEWQPINQ